MPNITCPHCGASRNTPDHQLPKQKCRARCPECDESFPFDPASFHLPPPDEASSPDDAAAVTGASVGQRRQLTGIGSLLTESWELFCRRGWGLCGIYLLALFLIILPLATATVILRNLATGNQLLILSCMILGIGYGLVGSFWMTAAMFHHVVDPHLTIRGAFANGRKDIGRFFWLSLLLGFIVAGGSFLLLIPGLIFMVWFFFCQYILAEDKIGGFAALEKSRRLVSGYGWGVFGRFLLLMLISLAVSALASRLPIVGGIVNLAITLLITPFSLLYYYLIYKDLQRCQEVDPFQQTQSRRWPFLITALLGWLLIPGLLILSQQQALFDLATKDITHSGTMNQAAARSATLAELTEDQSREISYQPPQNLTASEYDRLLQENSFPAEQQGVDLGPAVLMAKQFWIDEQNPHLWLEVKLADLPNMALSTRRSARILIDSVLDTEQKDQYNRQHSFESTPFQWVDIHTDDPDQGFSGTRYVYLKQGARPELISSINGRLELNLPLGIESLEFKRQDVGKVFSIDGKKLKLETLDRDRLSISFQGEPLQILRVRAFNRQEEPLREEGETWQSDGQRVSLQQIFNGQIDAITVLVATETLTRSYPFEITR